MVTAVPDTTATFVPPEVSVAQPEDPVAAAASALTCTSCVFVSVGAKIVTTSASEKPAMAFEDANVPTPVIAETTRSGRFASAWPMGLLEAPAHRTRVRVAGRRPENRQGHVTHGRLSAAPGHRRRDDGERLDHDPEGSG